MIKRPSRWPYNKPLEDRRLRRHLEMSEYWRPLLQARELKSANHSSISEVGEGPIQTTTNEVLKDTLPIRGESQASKGDSSDQNALLTVSRRERAVALRRLCANFVIHPASSSDLIHRWFRARFNPLPTFLYLASFVPILQTSGWIRILAIVVWILVVFPTILVSDSRMYELRAMEYRVLGSFLTMGFIGQLTQHLTDDGRIPGKPSFWNVRALMTDIKRVRRENEAKEAAHQAARRAAEEEARKRELALKQENERKERETQETARREHEESIAAGYLPFRRIAQLRLVLPRWPKDASDFEWIARDWIEAWGDSDAEVTPQSHDYGIDVVSAHCVAQVKFYSNSPVGRPEIQKFKGAAYGFLQSNLFFAYANGYTLEAIEEAELKQVGLFTFEVSNGQFVPQNHLAEAAIKFLASLHRGHPTNASASSTPHVSASPPNRPTVTRKTSTSRSWEINQSGDLEDDDFDDESVEDETFGPCESCGGVGELMDLMGDHREICGYCYGSGLQTKE